MKNQNTVTIILCAGKLNYSELPVATQHSNAMLPVNGRPVIGWILDDLLKKGIQKVNIVVRTDDYQLQRFLNRAFLPRMDLTLLRIKNPPTILHSLQAGLVDAKTITDETLVRILLGDTLITDTFSSKEDFLYYGQVDYSKRWCLVSMTKRGFVTDFHDKEVFSANGLNAAAGYYHLNNGKLLKLCIERAIAANNSELSQALELYIKTRHLIAKPVQQWYDFGHIDRLAEARQKLLSTRSFNSVTVDSVHGTITKSSTDHEKLQEELLWYKEIPNEIKILCPRILSSKITDSQVQLTQEYYGYGNLAELYVFSELSPETWGEIIKRVLKVHNLLKDHKKSLNKEDLISMYQAKTFSRLEKLKNSSQYWLDMLNRKNIKINGTILSGFENLRPLISNRIDKLSSIQDGCIIHGDFCFSNILYDMPHQIVRLVDPRGSFGEKGIYGDPRYDMAKLRHSISGLYDFIVADMFSIKNDCDGYKIEFFTEQQIKLSDIFDELLNKQGYNVSDIAFIEGLLFLSMLPLHSDKPKRQTAMFCRALQILNKNLCT